MKRNSRKGIPKKSSRVSSLIDRSALGRRDGRPSCVDLPPPPPPPTPGHDLQSCRIYRANLWRGTAVCETRRVNVAAYEIAAIETVLAGVMPGMRKSEYTTTLCKHTLSSSLSFRFHLATRRIASIQSTSRFIPKDKKIHYGKT